MCEWKYKVIDRHCPKGFPFKDYISAVEFCEVNNIPLSKIHIYDS